MRELSVEQAPIFLDELSRTEGLSPEDRETILKLAEGRCCRAEYDDGDRVFLAAQR